MDTNTLLLAAFGIVIVGATIWNSRRPMTISVPTNKDLLDKIADLVRENSELKSLVISLRAELQELRTAEIGALKKEVTRLNLILTGNNTQPGANRPRITATTPSLLLVLGTDTDINEREINALDQSGLDYRVCGGPDGAGATLRNFIDECNRRRTNKDLPLYVDFSMHGFERALKITDGTEISEETEGILQFRDREVTWHEISDQLKGVEIVMLASCAGTRLADQVAGIATHVVSFTQEVRKEDALRFDLVFWREIKEGHTAADAFVDAKKAVVGAKRFVDFQ